MKKLLVLKAGLIFITITVIKKSNKKFSRTYKSTIELKKPLIVHSRNAEDETFEILNDFYDESQNLITLFHRFKKFADKLLKLNSYFSASGIITFNNSIELQDTLDYYL